MKYMLLIYHDEQGWNRHTEAERQQVYREYRQLIQQLQSGGQYLAGNQLQPTTTASTVRVRDGKQMVTDGPFAETREQIGGFFMIDGRTVIDGPFAEAKELVAGYWMWQCKSLEEAIDWVKRCPNPHNGERLRSARYSKLKTSALSSLPN